MSQNMARNVMMVTKITITDEQILVVLIRVGTDPAK